jgi:hypothetical protein|tara:strand:- start:471 stop:590 length:120 start_codon:yes stop_codon:yes gene_type:complete
MAASFLVISFFVSVNDSSDVLMAVSKSMEGEFALVASLA